MLRYLALLLILATSASAQTPYADQLKNNYEYGVNATLNRLVTGQPPADYIQQQQNLQIQRQIIEQQQLQNQLLKEEAFRQRQQELRDMGRPRNQVNCTTVGTGIYARTTCR